MKNKLTQKYLKECLVYNPETGVFIWKERPANHFIGNSNYNNITKSKMWNKKYANKEAKNTRYDKYIAIGIDGKAYLAHRLAFLYMEGYMPENNVDHINRIRDDNKWCNLREVTQTCNMQNMSLMKNNKTGVAGVSWNKKRKRWNSNIRINKSLKFLGSFKNFDDAVKARYNEELTNDLWNCNYNSTSYQYLIENNLI